jgi:hypothetical protein
VRAAWLRLGFGLSLLFLAGPARAQDPTLEPSAAQRCLTPVDERRGEPVYPPHALMLGAKGRVKVELAFAAHDKRPAVTVLDSDGDRSFVDAVKEHVAAFRVPCLGRAEAPARLVIEYVFRPGDGRHVSWTDPLDADAAARGEMLKCLRHESGDKAPAYPLAARRNGVQGRVLTRLRFDSADQPPQAQVFARPGARLLARQVKDWVQGYRLPCLGGAPLEMSQVFAFVFEGEVYGFKPASLVEFLAAVKGIRSQRLQFDFNAMGCPFDVRLRYRQPDLVNAVGTPGPPDASRRDFLDWLGRAELALPGPSLDAIFGDEVTLRIPCTKIDLNPKE